MNTNTELYKEFENTYPCVLGSNNNISYHQFLEEKVIALQQEVKLFAIPDVSNTLKCECENAQFTRVVDSDYNPTCGKCGGTI